MNHGQWIVDIGLVVLCKGRSERSISKTPILSRREESGMTLAWGELHLAQDSCSEQTLNISAFKYHCCRSGRQFKFSEPWLCFRLLRRYPSHAGRSEERSVGKECGS